jgi:hypothetical protein
VLSPIVNGFVRDSDASHRELVPNSFVRDSECRALLHTIIRDSDASRQIVYRMIVVM